MPRLMAVIVPALGNVWVVDSKPAVVTVRNIPAIVIAINAPDPNF